MRLTTKQLNKDYQVNIEKLSNNKYTLDNKTFDNLKDTKDYLDSKIINNSVINSQKLEDYKRFKFIIINGKQLKHYNYAILDQLYGFIDWSKVKNHHLCLSINIEEKTELVIPNLYDNRNKTLMKQYQNKTRLGDQGTARQPITRIEQKTINTDKLKSIYCYGIKTDSDNKIIDKYNIVNLYRRQDKKTTQVLAPIDHRLIITKNNQAIHFKNNKSSVYIHNEIEYQCYLKNDQLYLSINNNKLSESFAQIKFYSIPKIEYTYTTSGYPVNDKNKGHTLGKVKKLLNNNELDKLWDYLSNNRYVLSYQKKLNDNGKIEKLTINYDYGKSYFNLNSVRETKINSYPYDNYKILYNISLWIATIESNLNKISLDIIDLEDKIYDEKDQDKKIKLEIQLQNAINKETRLINLIKDYKSITEKDIKTVVNKFINSVSNKENVESLNKSLGINYENSLKVYSTNTRLTVKDNKGKTSKVSIKKIEKLTLRFIDLLSQNNLVIDDKTYGLNYFRITINRDDFNNPYKEKINISKKMLDPKILNDFNKFMLILCMDHFSPNTHKPLIYPSSVDNISSWIRINNNYLSTYGIEIIEIK